MDQIWTLLQLRLFIAQRELSSVTLLAVVRFFLVLTKVLLERDSPHENLVRRDLLQQHKLVLVHYMNHVYLFLLSFPSHSLHLLNFLGPTLERISSVVYEPIMVGQLKSFVHFFSKKLVPRTEQTLVKLAFFENWKTEKTFISGSLVLKLFLLFLVFKLLLKSCPTSCLRTNDSFNRFFPLGFLILLLLFDNWRPLHICVDHTWLKLELLQNVYMSRQPIEPPRQLKV